MHGQATEDARAAVQGAAIAENTTAVEELQAAARCAGACAYLRWGEALLAEHGHPDRDCNAAAQARLYSCCLSTR